MKNWLLFIVVLVGFLWASDSDFEYYVAAEKDRCERAGGVWVVENNDQFCEVHNADTIR
ncbi:hypothetical protein ACWA5Z_12180 [Testudinibacter sp. P80/BLE/0925]|uniref:hypothetical protein n=1 Tax=Testudinibacter sp. TW-1 TaxID=3417757 RepID=UPI003D369C5E